MIKDDGNGKNALSEMMQEYAKRPSRKKLDNIGKQLRDLNEEEIISALLDAAQNCGEDVDTRFIQSGVFGNGGVEEKLAEICVRLAEYAVDRQNIKGVSTFKADVRNNSIVVYALTPEAVELPFSQAADHPQAKQLLAEKEKLEAELFSDQDGRAKTDKVIGWIESGLL